MSLGIAFEALDFVAPQLLVLGAPSLDMFPPASKASRLQRSPHQFNDFAFGESKLMLDRIKGGTVLPRHLNDAIEIPFI